MLRKGDRGPQVLQLQRHLLRLGYPLQRFGADASLGTETLAAVRLFEQDRHLQVSPNDVVSDGTVAAAAKSRPYLRGLDVSKWQGEIDWREVAAAGYRWVYVKATEGRTGVDPTYARNIAGARAAGLVAGPYMFWHPERDPLEQARHFARVAGPWRPGQLPPVLDVERENSLTPSELNDLLQELIVETFRLFGAMPVIYSSRRVYTEWGLSAGGECGLWMVSWSSRERLFQPFSSWLLWQTGPASGVPGIAGEVDRNLFAGGEEELRALAGE